MNPTAGSFEVCERAAAPLRDAFASMPGTEDLKHHLRPASSPATCSGGPRRSSRPARRSSTRRISLHQAVQAARFLPSAVKFVYNWNMRELTNIFQGMTLSSQNDYTNPLLLLRLFVHEACRVIQDRMISEQEMAAALR